MRFHSLTTLVFVSLSVLFTLAGPDVVSGQVNGNTGAFSTSVPIQVPSHRGLEPSLSLVYSSSRGNGIVGVGWSLVGFPVVERQGADGGSPQFNSSDSYRLSGRELKSCGESSSPGCQAGGTHFTEYENYQRITYDSGLDQWTVDARNGTTSTYTAQFLVGSETFRWGLETVTDTLGNTVTYDWWCDGTEGTKDCYPDSVSYNGYRIQLYYRDDREDVASFATGETLGETGQLLRSIKVELDNGTAIRAYQLEHVTSASTNRSLLDSVQIFGSDVVIDSSGVISGGTSLPAESFEYLTDPSAESFTGGGESWGDGCLLGALPNRKGSGDFNGDGLQDTYCHDTWETGTIEIGLSDGTRFVRSNWGEFCSLNREILTTGDFNGDGKTDFMCEDRVGAVQVALSTGSGLQSSVWRPYPGCPKDGGTTVMGDFNGDGMTDMGCIYRYPHSPQFTVGLSNGERFVSSGSWIYKWCGENNERSHGETWGDVPKSIYTGDYDGDGDTDVMCASSWGWKWVALSNGSAFVHDGMWSGSQWPLNVCGWDFKDGLGDFNGDGKTDFYCRNSEKTKVGLSDGSEFQVSDWLGATSCTHAGVADMNGDGRSDFWCHDESTEDNRIGLSDGVGSFSDYQSWKSDWCSEHHMVVGDFNGDSKTDLLCETWTDSSVVVSGSIVNKTDLLTSHQSSLGGETTVAYTPGTQWSQTQSAPVAHSLDISSGGTAVAHVSTHPMTPGSPTVTSVTSSDGLGWSATISYEYADGFYNAAERRWLGYRYSKTTLPALANENAGPYIQSEYSQDIAAPGTLEAQLRRDGNGNALSGLVNTLMVAGDGESEPYTARISARTTYTYDGSGTECTAWPCTTGERTYQEYDYDTYGNRVTTRSYGNYDATGDESTSVAEYFPNTSEYVVNKAARTVSYLGIGTAGAKLSESLFYFDGATQYTEAPLAGLLTNQGVWRDTDDSYVFQCALSECFEYDTYGNLTKVVNTKGGKTTIAYDTAYALFPESTKNALGHTFSSSWDPVCEGPLSTTDANGQITTTTYDALCRHARTDGPLGGFVQTTYARFGKPKAQHTRVETPSANGTGTQWSRHYFDGLGRPYRSKRRGPRGGQRILSDEVTYNARGAVATAARPRFARETPYMSSFEYDARNRQTEATLPDAATLTVSYGLRSVTTKNPEGHITVTERNDTGLTSYLDGYLGGNPITTTTTTDLGARTRTVTDHVGNVLVTSFNSLGQITKIDAPDSGIETREYNDAGELTAVTNAIGERTEFTYDFLGRMRTKTTLAGTRKAETTTFVYDESRRGYFNVGYQTSMLDAAGHRYDDYDKLGFLVKSVRRIDRKAYKFNFKFNEAGLLSATRYPDGQTIRWTYDAAGNLQTETGTIRSATYDALGRATSTRFANGVTATNTYSPERGWLERIRAVTGSTVHQDLAYTYYADGMVRAVRSMKAMESWGYVYDDLNRLLHAKNFGSQRLNQSFAYDAIGNITYNSQIGKYRYSAAGKPRPHAVRSAGLRKYKYNAAGQMTSRNGTLLQWNGDGKPSSIGNVAFTYDGLGTRLKKTSGGQTTTYVGSDYEIASDGTVTKYLLGGKQVGTEFFILHRDHLGSVRAVTDTAGAEVRSQQHTPFGDQHSVTGTHYESRGWIGEREEETELVYLNARYYDPEIGRFTAPDPIVFLGQGLNRYTYALNNPINLSDPSGLSHSGVACVTTTLVFRGYDGEATYQPITTCVPMEEEETPPQWYRPAPMGAFVLGLPGANDWDNDDHHHDGDSPNVGGATTANGDGTAGNNPTGAGTTVDNTPQDDNTPSGCPALGCGSTTKVAEQVVQKWDNDVKLITKTWVFSASIALPAAPAVLGARAGLTTIGTTTTVGRLVPFKNGYIGREIIGWGAGRAAQTGAGVQQTMSVNINMTRETVQSWIRQGVGRDFFEGQLAAYKSSLGIAPRWANEQLIPRLALARHALSLW